MNPADPNRSWDTGDDAPDFQESAEASSGGNDAEPIPPDRASPNSVSPGSTGDRQPVSREQDESDDDVMQFGEVSEAEPETELRPDENKHFQVHLLGSLRDDDLPIYVDLDAMRDMEAHALSDRSVELGGVMLGGQYVDRDGQPFVVITDSLRARHYESTKGSFKFTHETWEQITREREEFPEELQMVGWYHTHPDWGVFLSGMDMFICDNFFNRPLDVALVIDPCRADRGMFQWTPDGRERVRRTNGFFVMASRFREAELIEFVEALEGSAMAADPRFVRSGASSNLAPVIHLNDNRATSQNVLLGMLGAQFVLLAVLAWRVLLPASGAAVSEDANAQQEDPTAALAEKIEELTEARMDADRAQIQMRLMDRVLSRLGETQPGFLQELASREEQVDQLEAAIRGHRVYEKDLESQLTSFEDRLKRVETESEFALKQREKKYDDLAVTFKKLKDQHDELLVENTRYRKQLGLEEKPAAGKEDPESVWSRFRWPLIFGTLVVLILAAVVASLSGKSPPREERVVDAEDESSSDEPLA